MGHFLCALQAFHKLKSGRETTDVDTGFLFHDQHVFEIPLEKQGSNGVAIHYAYTIC